MSLSQTKQVLNLWDVPATAEGDAEVARSAKEVLGPISYFASDGEALRRCAFLDLVTYHTFDDFPWARSLKQCELMDQFLGLEGTTHCFDWKHLVKRFRERLKSHTTGVLVGEGARVTGSTLRKLLGEHQPSLRLDELFEPSDR